MNRVVLCLCLILPFFSALNFAVSFYGEGASFDSAQSVGKGLLLVLPFLLVVFWTLHRFYAGVPVQGFSALIGLSAPLLLSYAYALLSSSWSPYPVYSAVRSAFLGLVTLHCILLVVLYNTVWKGSAREKLFSHFHLALFLLCASVLALAGLGFENAWTHSIPGLKQRLGGTILNANTLGLIAGILVLASAHLWRRKPALAIAGILLGGYELLATQSRTAMICLLAAAVLDLTFLRPSHHRALKWVLYPSSLVVCSLALVMFLDPELLAGFARTGDLEEISSLSNRVHIWAIIWESLQGANMLFGNGFGMLTPAGPVLYESRSILHAHNGYLQILAGTGIIGAAALAIFFLRVLKRGLRLKLSTDGTDPARPAAAIILFVLISNLSEASLGDRVLPQYLVFLICCCILCLQPERDAR